MSDRVEQVAEALRSDDGQPDLARGPYRPGKPSQERPDFSWTVSRVDTIGNSGP